MYFHSKGMCSSNIIRSNRIAIPECHRLQSDLNKVAIQSNRSWTFAVLGIYSRSLFSTIYLPISLTIPLLLFLTFEYMFSFICADEDIEAIIARGRQVRCMWVYASDSEPCSAMRGIMWELQRKVRQFHQSAETFWLHNGSIVNRNLVEFSKWKLPVPLPW